MQMKRKVVIPSAKIVSVELQTIGKLPAVIYPVNQDTMFKILKDTYKDTVDEYEIVVYEAAEKVQKRLSKYKDKVNIHKLDVLKDLGYSVYCGIREAKCSDDDEIIINLGDTILYDEIESGKDICFYQEEAMSDRWTYFEESDGVITRLWDKNAIIEDKRIVKNFFVGVFVIRHPNEFMKCIENAWEKECTEDSFYSALCEYSKKWPMDMRQVKEWFDIGHLDKYYDAQLEVKSRAFNHIEIDKNRGILKKTSDDKSKFIGEILWYLKLPSDIEYVRPRIFGYSTDYNKPYVKMEYYSYHTLHELFLNGDLSKKQWQEIFSRIKFIVNDFKRYEVCDSGIKEAVIDMYLNKTMERLAELRNDSRFLQYFEKPITVNGVEYKNLDEICQLLPQVIEQQLCDVERFNIIHGDLCFANILVDSNRSFIKVIDPRGKFGKYDIYGDRRYEYAKLIHSIDGKYDYIIKDLFQLEIDGNKIDFTIDDRQREFDLFECFMQSFSDEISNDEIIKIELIEALLFLSMVPLHTESFRHQIVMLATGLKILDRVIDIKM